MSQIGLGTINLQNRRWISYLRRSGTWGPRRISRGFGEMRLRWDWLMLSMKEGSHLPTHSCSLTHAESLGYIMKLKLISSSYLTHAESWSPFMLTYSGLCSLFYYSAQSWPSLMLTYFCFITRLDHDPHSCSLTFALSLVSIMTLTRAHLRLLNHKAWSWSSFTLRHSCPLTHAHSTMLTKSCLLMLSHSFILTNYFSLIHSRSLRFTNSLRRYHSLRLTHSRIGCPIFASYFFSLRSETKRNKNRFASFSLRFAKLKKKFFASFLFFSLQSLRFVSLQFFTTCDLEGVWGGRQQSNVVANLWKIKCCEFF